MPDLILKTPASTIWDAISPALEYPGATFPEEAVRSANTHRAEITPYLVKALIDVRELVLARAPPKDCFLPTFALMLLTQWREPAGFAPLVEIAALPGDLPEDALGESVFEDFPFALALMSGGTEDAVRTLKTRLIENEALDAWVRESALRSLLVMTHTGGVTRTELLAYCGGLLGQAIDAGIPHVKNTFPTLVVSLFHEMRAQECMEQIRAAYAAGIIDRQHTSLDDFDELFASDPKAGQLQLGDLLPRYDDAAADMRQWDYFNPKTAQQERETLQGRDQALAARRPLRGMGNDSGSPFQVAMPFVREAPKTGRNDPCPCGSGKKFKKCHGQ